MDVAPGHLEVVRMPHGVVLIETERCVIEFDTVTAYELGNALLNASGWGRR